MYFQAFACITETNLFGDFNPECPLKTPLTLMFILLDSIGKTGKVEKAYRAWTSRSHETLESSQDQVRHNIAESGAHPVKGYEPFLLLAFCSMPRLFVAQFLFDSK